MNDESFLQVYKSNVPRQLFAWATILPDVGCGKCRTGYFINTGNQQQCGEPIRKPIPCLSAIQWHAGKEGSQPEKDATKEQYIMSGVASAVDSDGRARVFYTGETVTTGQGADILDPVTSANPASVCVPMACEENA
uniref:DUF1559 domain-containing protein n=1 Tax=Mesocestoides corti TaxID=53468 RepID=A0A5K3F3A2_MESCO